MQLFFISLSLQSLLIVQASACLDVLSSVTLLNHIERICILYYICLLLHSHASLWVSYLFVYISVNFSRATLKSPSSLHPGILFTILFTLMSVDGTMMGKERDIQSPVCSGFHQEVAFWWLTILLAWHFRSWRAGCMWPEALSAHPRVPASRARKYHNHKQSPASLLEEGQYWTLKLWGVNLALPSVRSQSRWVPAEAPLRCWGSS